jgi:hypothetical protein
LDAGTGRQVEIEDREIREGADLLTIDRVAGAGKPPIHHCCRILYIKAVPRHSAQLTTAFAAAAAEGGWFVYLLALADGAAFKVGFSCHPLHRAFTFSRRYFEQFDLDRSLLVRFDTCPEARVLEAAIKNELAEHRYDCPSWVPAEAGGQTEWFDAFQWQPAEDRVRAATDGDESRLLYMSDFVRTMLLRQARSFEFWAVHQAQFVAQALSSPSDAHLAFGSARALRDWLDAYRCCGIPLFPDDPAAHAFVTDAARQSG